MGQPAARSRGGRTSRRPSGVFHDRRSVPTAREAQAFVTSDNQVTVIVPEGAFATKRRVRSRSRSRSIRSTRRRSASPGAGVDDLRQRVPAAGDVPARPATGRRWRSRSTLSLIYPVTPEPPRGSASALPRRPTGGRGRRRRVPTRWRSSRPKGRVPELGYVMVAGDVGPSPVTPAGGRRLLEHRDRADRARGVRGPRRARPDRAGTRRQSRPRQTSRRRRRTAGTGSARRRSPCTRSSSSAIPTGTSSGGTRSGCG